MFFWKKDEGKVQYQNFDTTYVTNIA